MALDQVKIEIDDLIVGMYVSRLDRPWIQTPFPIQGYFVKTAEDIQILKQYCKHVYIDVQRGKAPVDPHLLTLQQKPKIDPLFEDENSQKSSAKLKKNIGFYTNSTSLKKEVKNAKKIKQLAFGAATHIETALKSGSQINFAETRQVITAMVHSVIRNPDAFLWIAKIEDADAYLYGSSVRTTLWSIAFGRHLGLKTTALENLALGVMLSEVGKITLPEELIKKDEDNLDDEEWMQYTSHVENALEILKEYKSLDPQVLSVVGCINERHNGTGYPRGLRGDQVPLLAKIAGIAKYYDMLTFPRNNQLLLDSADAINRIYKMRNRQFQRDIVDEFIQAIGIYPVGTLVELSTMETAIVVEQNPSRRLRPKVMLLLDSEKQRFKKFKTIDLEKTDINKDGTILEIIRSLPVGSYGADPAVIFESAFGSKWKLSLAS